MSNSLLGLVLSCRWCEDNFYICRGCYRGHVYCSVACRTLGYALRKRLSRKKHDDSIDLDDLRADIAKRVAKHRKKKKSELSRNISEQNVTDKGRAKTFSQVSQANLKTLHDLKSQGNCIVCDAPAFARRL